MKFVHKMRQQLKHLNLYQMNPNQLNLLHKTTLHDQVLDISTCNSSYCSGNKSTKGSHSYKENRKML